MNYLQTEGDPGVQALVLFYLYAMGTSVQSVLQASGLVDISSIEADLDSAQATIMSAMMGTVKLQPPLLAVAGPISVAVGVIQDQVGVG